MPALDNVPVATYSYIAGVIIAIIGYISNDLTVFQALAAVGIVGFGGGKIGEARNGAGRGVRH